MTSQCQRCGVCSPEDWESYAYNCPTCFWLLRSAAQAYESSMELWIEAWGRGDFRPRPVKRDLRFWDRACPLPDDSMGNSR